jgi:hypothetical protein
VSSIGLRVDACVRRQDVDSAVLRDDGGRHRRDRRPIRNIGRQGERVQSFPAEARRGRLGEFDVEIAEHHAGAFCSKDGRDPAPNASRGTGDNGDLVVKTLHNGVQMDAGI